MPSMPSTAWTLRRHRNTQKVNGSAATKLTNPGCSYCNSLFVSETI
ncbi:hypothetical protein LMG24076_04057 [Trinickia soli]|nr:hypothetical protein LMG24076_04057 [Trinickia soli]